jgi:hypothetical protein
MSHFIILPLCIISIMTNSGQTGRASNAAVLQGRLPVGAGPSAFALPVDRRRLMNEQLAEASGSADRSSSPDPSAIQLRSGVRLRHKDDYDTRTMPRLKGVMANRDGCTKSFS